MRKLETADDIENALGRLMPVALSERAGTELDEMIDSLSGNLEVEGSEPGWNVKWRVFGGIAAAAAFAALIFSSGPSSEKDLSDSTTRNVSDEAAEVVFLTESDRVEEVSDEGLYVDAGGSAVRKVRVRVVEESQLRDEETGIVVMLTEPREETYMVPVSTF